MIRRWNKPHLLQLVLWCHIKFVQRDKETRGFAQGVGFDEKGKGEARAEYAQYDAGNPISHRVKPKSQADIVGQTGEAPRSVSTRRQCNSSDPPPSPVHPPQAFAPRSARPASLISGRASAARASVPMYHLSMGPFVFVVCASVCPSRGLAVHGRLLRHPASAGVSR